MFGIDSDPVRMLIESYFTAVKSIGQKVRQSLETGNKPECSEDIKSVGKAVMVAIQSLLQDRLKLNGILEGNKKAQGIEKLNQTKTSLRGLRESKRSGWISW